MKSYRFFPILSLVIIFVGCHTPSISPEQTAKKFIDALESFDVEAARSLLVQNPENAMMIGEMERAAASMGESDKVSYREQFKNRQHNFKVQNEQDDRVVVVATTTADGTAVGGFTFVLLKQKGEWKIERLSPN